MVSTTAAPGSIAGSVRPMTSVAIQRLADSCVRVEVDGHSALIDPGFYTWEHEGFDLDSMVPPDRLLITHNHTDHLSVEFVEALHAAHPDMTIETNDEVAKQLEDAGISALTESASWTRQFDTPHERTPMDSQPQNVGFVVDDVFVHPGDSYTFDVKAPVLALPLLPPWGSSTEAVAVARRIRPEYVVPIHDWYVTQDGRRWLYGAIERVLSADGITLLRLDDFESVTVEVG